MKYALVFLCDDGYMKYGYTMVSSFLKHNPWFDGDIVVLCDDEICKFSDRNLEKLKNLNRNINIYRHFADYNKYEYFVKRFYEKLYLKHYCKAFYKYECFNLRGYDRVVFYDADIMVVGDVKELFFNDKDLIFTEDNFDFLKSDFYKFTNERISSGGFSVSSKYLNDDIYNGLLNATSTIPIFGESMYDGGCPEQQVMDFYFKNFKDMWLMPRKYNCCNYFNNKILTNFEEFKIVCSDLRAIHLYAKPINNDTSGKDEILKMFYEYFDNLNDDLVVYTCTVARKENLYLKEFVEWYRKIGVTKMFIYDNGFGNEENPNFILREYIDDGFVELINFRDIEESQNKSYNDFLSKNKNEYDWAFFVDVDEFLTFGDGINNIQDFLKMQQFNGFDSICVNWQMYTDNNKIYYENKPIMERFTEKANDDNIYNMLGKIFIRGGVDFQFSLKDSEFHWSERLKTCNDCGEEIKNAWNKHKGKYAVLNHYFSKSLEEYIVKTQRGYGINIYGEDFSSEEFLMKQISSFYFYTNKITEEKNKYLGENFGFIVHKKINDVAIVFISHKQTLNEYERKSVESCFNVFKNRDIYVILPKDVDNSEYAEIAKKCNKDVTFIYEDKKWLCSYKDYNQYLKQPFFYEKFKDYKYIQTYQLDCYALYDNLDYFIEKGFEYYAPVEYFDGKMYGKPFCGGFSLRNVDAFIKNSKSRMEECEKDTENEDDYFISNPNGIKSVCTRDIGEEYCWDSFVLTPSLQIKCVNKEKINPPMALHLYGRNTKQELFDYIIDYYNNNRIKQTD